MLALLLALAGPGEEPLMRWYPPEDSEIEHNRALGSVREMSGGYTRIVYARRAVKGGINSVLERHVFEDGPAYRIYRNGRELYCACDPDNFPLITARIFRTREIYYFVADDRARPFGYRFDAVEVRTNGATHYRCDFGARLRLADGSRKPRDRDRTLGNISDYLTDHGADLDADHCRVAGPRSV
jgi:hypothetical protein